MTERLKLCKIRRAMLDEINNNDKSVTLKWSEYHRLRKLLANNQGISLKQAENQLKISLPDGSLLNEK
jgi:hypothetical protein